MGYEIAALRMNFAKKEVKMVEAYDAQKRSVEQEKAADTKKGVQKMRREVKDKRKDLEQRIIDDEHYYTSAVEASSPIEQLTDSEEHSDGEESEDDPVSATCYNAITRQS